MPQPLKITRTPMNDTIRRELRYIAENYVASFKKEHAQLRDLHQKIDKLFLDKLNKFINKKDMDVLHKYDRHYSDTRVNYHQDSGIAEDGKDKRCRTWRMKVTYRYHDYSGPTLRNITPDTPLGKLLTEYRAVAKIHEDRYEMLTQRYVAFINNAVTLEEIALVWNRAAELLTKVRKSPKAYNVDPKSYWADIVNTVRATEEMFINDTE